MTTHTIPKQTGRSLPPFSAPNGKVIDPKCIGHHIRKTITGYARQRRVALAGFGARALYASDAIVLAMHGAETCSLYAIARRVVRVGKHIEDLAPGSQSRFRKYYMTAIAPLVSWCEEFVKQHS